MNSSKIARLRTILRKMGRVVVAYSGGVDSAFLLKIASEELGPDVLAVIASSETYPGKETRDAERLARKLKVRFETIHTSELDNPEFRRNPPRRCYHCKKELWGEMLKVARREGISTVVDGQNLDDEDDFRPGAQASREMGIRSPLKEAGWGKDEIRAYSRKLGLPTWNKPHDFIQTCSGIGVMRRHADQVDLESLEKILPGITAKVHIVEAPILEISSKQIRQRIEESMGYRYYLRDAVYQAITEMGMYK